MSVPDPYEMPASGVVASSSFNAGVHDALAFLLDPPIAQMRQTSAQSINNSAWTSLTFTAEDVDSENGHDNATNTSRYTAVEPGWYSVGAGYGSAVNATGSRGVRYTVNGSVVLGSGTFLPATAATAAYYPGRPLLVYLAAGDYLEAQVFQNSGGALNTAVPADQTQSSLSALWVRKSA